MSQSTRASICMYIFASRDCSGLIWYRIYFSIFLTLHDICKARLQYHISNNLVSFPFGFFHSLSFKSHIVVGNTTVWTILALVSSDMSLQLEGLFSFLHPRPLLSLNLLISWIQFLCKLMSKPRYTNISSLSALHLSGSSIMFFLS